MQINIHFYAERALLLKSNALRQIYKQGLFQLCFDRFICRCYNFCNNLFFIVIKVD